MKKNLIFILLIAAITIGLYYRFTAKQAELTTRALQLQKDYYKTHEEAVLTEAEKLHEASTEITFFNQLNY
jgi:uncharacterized protein YxeA